MRFTSRRIVMPYDLNAAGTLFGGRALAWIDEEAAIFAMCQLGSKHLVTKHMGEILFQSPAMNGDIIEFGVETTAVGRTSITVRCLMRNKDTKKDICLADEIVFVQIDPTTRLPHPHGKTLETLTTF